MGTSSGYNDTQRHSSRSNAALRYSVLFITICCVSLKAHLSASASSAVDATEESESDIPNIRSFYLRTHRHLQSSPEDASGEDWTSSVPFFLQMILIVVLVLLSGLFSGLTLGLMSLDKTGLEIVMDGGDPTSARQATKIYPIRLNGNLLLCTLLLGNVMVNSLLSILMAEMTSGMVGLIVSTSVIVIFGEILPQAACSRHALYIGSKTVFLVKIIICCLYPIAKPIAFSLDKMLGRELGTIYTKQEMRKLLEIHMEMGGIDKETGIAMEGALKYHDTTVKEVMTGLNNTFMLNVEDRLSFITMREIFQRGYSRIPVFEVSRNNIIGLLFVKDLIFVDPEDDVAVKSFVQIFGRGVHVVWPDDKLGDVLRELKLGKSHMALVRDVNNDDPEQDPFYEIKGIITLEDIIEVILGDEIVDETDKYIDVTHNIKVESRNDFDWGRLRMLDAKITDQLLSIEEVNAVAAHLRTNFSEAVSLLSDVQLKKLVSSTVVTELATAQHEVGEEFPRDLMYENGKQSEVCTLILSGKVSVLAGIEKFRSDVSSWCVLAPRSLMDSDYIPDFTAYVSNGPCRCVQISRERFLLAVDATAVEKTNDMAITSSLAITPNVPRDALLAVPDLQNKTEHASPSKVDGIYGDINQRRLSQRNRFLQVLHRRSKSNPESLETKHSVMSDVFAEVFQEGKDQESSSCEIFDELKQQLTCGQFQLKPEFPITKVCTKEDDETNSTKSSLTVNNGKNDIQKYIGGLSPDRT